jgi:hypothetical protein
MPPPEQRIAPAKPALERRLLRQLIVEVTRLAWRALDSRAARGRVL